MPSGCEIFGHEEVGIQEGGVISMLLEPVSVTRPEAEITGSVEPKARAKAQESGGKKQKQDVGILRDVMKVAQNHLHVSGVSVSFSVHEATGRIKVVVTDKGTGELIREIPPDEVLNLMAKIDEMMGILYDEKA
jgi:flagellar protein FlaG